jgi:hypothetical protein
MEQSAMPKITGSEYRPFDESDVFSREFNEHADKLQALCDSHNRSLICIAYWVEDETLRTANSCTIRGLSGIVNGLQAVLDVLIRLCAKGMGEFQDTPHLQRYANGLKFFKLIERFAFAESYLINSPSPQPNAPTTETKQ